MKTEEKSNRFPVMGNFVFDWEQDRHTLTIISINHYIFVPKKVGRNKQKPLLTGLTIDSIGAEGKAVTRNGELVVFTQYAVPGDVVDLQVTKKKSKYAEAFVTKFHVYSPDRVNAFCEHFGVCGGCKWQILPYDKQLYYKQKQVYDQLTRIGKVEVGEFQPILGSKKNVFYRNKLEFTFSNKRWLDFSIESSATAKLNALGFHVPGLFDKVININKCWLQPEPSNEIRNFIYEYALTEKLSFFDIKEKSGFLRTLIIRTSSIGQVMVVLSFFHEDLEKRTRLLEAVQERFPEITSLLYVINEKGNDTITDQSIEVFNGQDFIFDEMEGLRFKIGPKSFYQTNSEQAYNLYKVVRDFANPDKNDIVYDLYTGTGTIANFVARQVKKVVGIEYVPEAIEDAKINSLINAIDNTVFYAGDIKAVLNLEFFAKNGKPDIIITDPPRAGMHEDVIDFVIKSEAQKIVYVSCNPATQARDLALLSVNYEIVKTQPVDMFPHTHHVENVVLLNKIFFYKEKIV